MAELIYKIIKINQNSIIVILLFYGILYRDSAINFKFRLLYDMQGLSCSIYKVSTNMPTHSVTCGVTNWLKAWHLRPCHWTWKGEGEKGSQLSLIVQH